MTFSMTMVLFLFILAFLCEWIDSSLGMGYGTILSPVLLIIGFSPLSAVPAILISQAAGGFIASIFHHRYENADFRPASRDFKVTLIIALFGLAATVSAALLAIRLPRVLVKSYIGILVTLMGLLVLRNKTFTFSWNRMVLIGVISAFNKGISGGGFGPIVTAGQILSGQEHKKAIASTTLAEAPICLAGFLTYMSSNLSGKLSGNFWNTSASGLWNTVFSAGFIQWELFAALSSGAILAAPIGALTTRWFKTNNMNVTIGLLITLLGLWSLYKTFF